LLRCSQFSWWTCQPTTPLVAVWPAASELPKYAVNRHRAARWWKP
jgi:hypothetical protein